MRLCYIGWATSPHVVRWVRWFARRGHECHLVSDTPAAIEGVTVHVVQRDFYDPRSCWERLRDLSLHDYRLAPWAWLRLRIRQIRPDILHSFSLWYPGYGGLYTGFHPWTVFVFNGDVLWEPKGRPWFDRLRTRIALHQADLVTGESETLIRGCKRLGAASNKTHVIRLGVNLALFNCNRSKDDVRRELELPMDVPIILSPRSLTTANYNVETIVESIPLVRKQVPDALFIFTYLGVSGNRDFKLQERVRELGMRQAARFVGLVPYEKMALYHRAADVMVSISLADSGPIALQEAMACGAVPIMGDLPSVREWVINGENGRLVNPLDLRNVVEAIVDLLIKEEKRKVFGQRNLALIRERGDENMWMEKVEQLYLSLFR